MDILLVPMTQAEYDDFYEGDVRHFAEENIASGRWSREEATMLSREAHRQLLPDGRQTSDHRFYTAKDSRSDATVGVVWMAVRPREVFIYDIEVSEPLRGKGLGAKVLEAAEREAKALGATVVSLHVFCWNKRALSLYRKAGYETISANMSKRI